jgi:hypothetical protein
MSSWEALSEDDEVDDELDDAVVRRVHTNTARNALICSIMRAQWGHWPTSDVAIAVKITGSLSSAVATYPGHSPILEATSPAWKVLHPEVCLPAQ